MEALFMNLQDIFDEQIRLNMKINASLYTEMSDPEVRRQRFMQFELALRQESAEAIDSLNWKWWKKDEDNWDNVKVELIDMLHFWVSMCTVAGLDAKSVMDLYFKKNKLNHKRQEEGYKEGTYDKYQDGVEDNVRDVLGLAPMAEDNYDCGE
jgi:dimeric dUTPase (all-alpha-NTP-PPase superfamily)